MCLENVLNTFPAKKKKKTGLNLYVYDFSVDYNVIDNSNIIDICKCLMKNTI